MALLTEVVSEVLLVTAVTGVDAVVVFAFVSVVVFANCDGSTDTRLFFK